MKDITAMIKDLDNSGGGGKMYVLLGEEAQLIEEARAALRRKFPYPRERVDLEGLADSPVAQNRGDTLFGGGASLYEIVGQNAPQPKAVNRPAQTIRAPGLVQRYLCHCALRIN